LIKYIKSVLWRVAKCLSYIEEARCLKVKHEEENDEDLNFFRSPVPYMKQLPPTKKAILEVPVPKHVGR